MKRFAGLLLALGLLAGCSTGESGSGANNYEFTSPGGKTKIFYDGADRKSVPGFQGESLREPGKQIRLSDYPGKVVIINIWGSWCGPCTTEAPELAKAAAKFTNVQLLGVDVRDDRQAALDFLNGHQLSYPSLFDNPGRSLLAFHGFPASTVPATFVLDAKHRVAAVYLTALNAPDLEPELAKLTTRS